ncbi:uncharacterized protein FOMMEDRAFT_113229 [Fomitiporia mediterranea MF3/22]|uniref:uncharacterized protein n=1 Tax=Fomitiporia mediterranea (strain MF3/22) TaxID=694068 RepID=UPI000440831A|nr:uncharacterized protein FOMMEDRAFT_113229 [Fomitiporia mediterranea MF3/22]EJC99284.1 hypothetical protein FOMMEDRAFT_113229 [Fomitiporia mediterranea MF3/22]
MTKNDNKYTDPELRTEIKDAVQAGDKGGKPGQWSARKAQLMASEYKKAMHERDEEPYTTEKSEQSESQKHLNDWTKEEWQTSDASGNAKQDDGTEKRYLPKKAWESMTEEEKEETNKEKLEGSARGEQYVSNTAAARKARKDTQGEISEPEVADGAGEEENGTSHHHKEEESSPKRGTKRNANDQSQDEAESIEEELLSEIEDGNKAERQPAAKQAKVNKGDDEHGQPCSATRLPEAGQKVFWRATPGWVEGTVVEVAYSEKDVGGKHVKASKNDPRIILESAKSGKTAVHKPEAVYF